MVSSGSGRSGNVWHGLAGMAGTGEVGFGKSRCDKAR